MERTKYLFALLGGVILLAGVVATARAQSAADARAYRAYVTGDLAQWSGVIDELEQASRPQTEAERLELLNYYYCHIGYLLGSGAKTEAKRYLKKAMAGVNEVLESNPEQPAALAYKGIFLAYRMSMKKLSAPVLGPKTIRYIKRAYRSDPHSVETLFAMGNLLFHAPAVFGGDKAEGIAYIERAVAALESSGRTTGNWNYLNLLLMQAQYLEQTGEVQGASAVYEKMLGIEPDFVLVRDELYPALLNNLAGE